MKLSQWAKRRKKAFPSSEAKTKLREARNAKANRTTET